MFDEFVNLVWHTERKVWLFKKEQEEQDEMLQCEQTTQTQTKQTKKQNQKNNDNFKRFKEDSKKIVTVFGATGMQGGSVVDHLLRDDHFEVRGVTRDIKSEKSQK